jgi:hypothetical protein
MPSHVRLGPQACVMPACPVPACLAWECREGAQHTPTITADVFEALLGALYLDQVSGEVARPFLP